MRYFIQFSYDGSQFFGFQRQNDKITVQGTLELALSIINKSPVFIKGAGRTDNGVHATMQCAHFDLDVVIPNTRLLNALNRIVHPYIHIFSLETVDNSFHARFSVKRKKYVYKLWIGEFSPFREDYYLQYEKPIYLDKMKECAHLFLGRHNFHNFVSGYRDSYDGEIYEISFLEKDNELWITFLGKSFYRYMIRNLVGALLAYNEGKCDIITIKRMIEDVNFNYQLPTVPARGLYLEGVYYD